MTWGEWASQQSYAIGYGYDESPYARIVNNDTIGADFAILGGGMGIEEQMCYIEKDGVKVKSTDVIIKNETYRASVK